MLTLDTERERVLGEQPRDARPKQRPSAGGARVMKGPQRVATTIIVACVHVKSGSG